MIRVDAPCLDCGKAIAVEILDGEVVTESPEGIYGYTAAPIVGPAETRPHR